MVLMHSNKREEIKEAQCGDIIAIVGLKDTTTGDTLCAVDAPVVLEKMDFPEPVIKVAYAWWWGLRECEVVTFGTSSDE